MLRVLVPNNPQVETRSGTSANGREWSFKQQSVRIYEDGTPFADKFTITLPEDVAIYPAGEYLLDLNSAYERGSYDSLDLSRSSSLIPLNSSTLSAMKKKHDQLFADYSEVLKKTA